MLWSWQRRNSGASQRKLMVAPTKKQRQKRERRRNLNVRIYSDGDIKNIMGAGDVPHEHREALGIILEKQARDYFATRDALAEKEALAPPVNKLRKALSVHHDMERFASNDLSLLEFAAGQEPEGSADGYLLVQGAISNINTGLSDLMRWSEKAEELKKKNRRNTNTALKFWADPLIAFWAEYLGKSVTHRNDGVVTRGSLTCFLKEAIRPIDPHSTQNVSSAVRSLVRSLGRKQPKIYRLSSPCAAPHETRCSPHEHVVTECVQ